MNYRLVSHCHSYYSFDSEMTIDSIVKECLKQDINAIVISDHDCIGLTDEDEKKFIDNKILVIRAIEFTTAKDVHIIGVSDRIRLLQRDRYYYSIKSIIQQLLEIGAYIIIPHPDHTTGILGNKNVSEDEAIFAIKNAHFVEVDNYNYGKTKSMNYILKCNKGIKCLVGSDAHIHKSIASKVNEFDTIEECGNQEDFIRKLMLEEIHTKSNMDRGKLYWSIKRVKSSKPYQFILHLFPEHTRRTIKNRLLKRLK